MSSSPVSLSPHFSLEEFTASQTAVRHGIANVPTPLQVENLTRLCVEILEPLRAVLGPVHISSGFRHWRVNRLIGGADDSQHCVGLAADFLVPGMDVLELCRWLYAGGLPYDQLIYEGGWCHVSVAAKGKKPRGRVLTAHFKPGQKTRYTAGLPGREGT